MLDTFMKFTEEVANPISVWVGIITFIPIVWLWMDMLWGRKRRHDSWFRNAKTTAGSLPVVFIVDLLAARDISAAVSHYLAQEDRLKGIPEERIIKVERNADLSPADMPALAQDIQDKIGEALRHGGDELHVFLAGPVIACAMVGAELSNIGGKVFLYQNDRSSNTYVNFGPLRHPRF